MSARPVFEIGDWLYVFGAPFARSPNTHDLDSGLRRTPQGLGHARAVIVAIHHRDIGADETKRPPVDFKSRAIGLHKTRTPATRFLLAPIDEHKQNRRAHNQSERGEKQLFPAHEN